ncbi:unnamed protein product [Penicillium nalgiovense]|uniref:O-methyltransferase domain-containing protein n=1 Tax=Penicillium nalgiovense TaxID=60175 RepID=A0A9W4MPF0_PENNA|nr:unnamed protein product [Penicillium nalgiovense]CAG7948397.1 unnamed protein product [Penicillium nalgiovense]CAG7966903.1 unnamed protein product [Penicillium nalgiovense]CAG7967261.1 unnamed protein product [Penicillium nalgiovense]CAG7980078.1 unnamed protein product [Penicillium nalgiovense]
MGARLMNFKCHQAITVRLAVDLKLFDAIAKRTSESEDGKVHVGQLSEDVNADPKLVGRIMRALVPLDILKQDTSDTFSSTPFAEAYVSTSWMSGAVIFFTHLFLFVAQLPEYFKQKGWKNPDDIDDSPFNFALGSKRGYFDYMASNPYYQDAFDTVMASPYRRDEKSWLDFFPVEEKLQVQSPSDVLLVDVGGGRGKDLLAFRKRFPGLQGRLVLQDLSHVTETADISCEIETQVHNFFDEQPVKNAKAYYLRTVLHDWPDKQAVEILSRIREAMGPYSSVLIHEKAMPETNIPWMAAIGDMTMMTAFSAAERTKNEWETLLNKAGLKLTGFWKPEGTSAQQQVIIEGAVRLCEHC